MLKALSRFRQRKFAVNGTRAPPLNSLITIGHRHPQLQPVLAPG